MFPNVTSSQVKLIKKLMVGLIMGVILLFIWSLYVDLTLSKLKGYLISINYSYIFLATIFYTLAYFFRSVRWQIILSPVHTIKYITSFALYVAGMLINFFIPLRAGDISRCVFLKKLAKVNISQSLPSVFLDKVMDVFPILIILPLIPIFSAKLNHSLYILIFLVILIFIILFVTLFISTKKTKLILAIFKYLISLTPDKFSIFKAKSIDSLGHFFNEINLFLKNTKTIFYVLTFTILCVLSDALFLYFFFCGFNNPLAFLKIFFGYTLIQLSYVLPYPPAQIGSNEILWTLIFCTTFGLDIHLMSAITLLAHLWIFLFHVLAGSAAIFSLWYRAKLHLISIRKSQESSLVFQENIVN